jgi:hypothetical protein
VDGRVRVQVQVEVGRFSKQEFRSQRDRGKNRKHVLSKAPVRSARELLSAVAVPLANFGDGYLTCYSSAASAERQKSVRLMLQRTCSHA